MEKSRSIFGQSGGFDFNLSSLFKYMHALYWPNGWTKLIKTCPVLAQRLDQIDKNTHWEPMRTPGKKSDLFFKLKIFKVV